MTTRATRHAGGLLTALMIAALPATPVAGAELAEGSALALPAIAFPPSPPSFEGIAPSDASESDGAEKKPAKEAKPTAETICRLIGKNAEAVGMPKDFFARLIWKESRFDAKAVSPVGAQGIAQFMPYTAAERGLEDPYDLKQAIRHSALYLADLRAELGNWGLAAAAYNGGINRVKGWIANGGSLPYETEAYVSAITFRSADWFKEDGHEIEHHPLDEELDFLQSCSKLPVMKTRSVFGSPGAIAESAPMRPWGVQVAGHEKQAVAMRMFQRVRSNFPALLKDEKPIVLRERTSPRRTIYAVRIGADTRAEANALCQKLRGAGGSCLVMKN